MAKSFRVTPVLGKSAFAATADLADYDPDAPPPPGAAARIRAIEARIAETARMGRLPLWDGYQEVRDYPRPVAPGASRSVKDVRSDAAICQFYLDLVTRKRPGVILEFGAAFGVSGMYWLAGLEEARQPETVGADLAGDAADPAPTRGELYSFEPNAEWCAIARANMASVSPRFHLTCGTFEDNVALVPPRVDLALIDAIHTGDFVRAQFGLVRRLCAPGALVVFDDVNFSADMRAVWAEIQSSPGIRAAWMLGNRAGLVELA